jgi:hypothetical protein
MIHLFVRDEATTHDPAHVRLRDYCREHGIEPDQIHGYPSFDIDFSDGSDSLFRCKGKIYHAQYSCGIFENLYEVTEAEAKELLQKRIDKFFEVKSNA